MLVLKLLLVLLAFGAFCCQVMGSFGHLIPIMLLPTNK